MLLALQGVCCATSGDPSPSSLSYLVYNVRFARSGGPGGWLRGTTLVAFQVGPRSDH